MRSSFALALCLSFISLSSAGASFRQTERRDAESSSATGIFDWIFRLFKRQEPPASDVCYQDDFYGVVYNSSFGERICNALIDYPNMTITVEYTPTSTFQDISTVFMTVETLVRTTSITTTTTTITPVGKRSPQITAMARDLSAMQLRQVADLYRREAGTNASTLDNEQIGSSLSSACSCQTYGGVTLTETYSNEPTVTTIHGFVKAVTTETSVRTAGGLTTVVTVTASPASATGGAVLPSGSATVLNTGSSSTADGSFYAQTTGINQTGAVSNERPNISSSAPAAHPTAPLIRCPDDNGLTVHQLIGNERFDYDIYCEADLPNAPDLFKDLSYGSFAECVAACSKIDGAFDQPACQGVVYYDVPKAGGNNCFLNAVANSSDTVMALSIDVAILKTIAVGIAPQQPNGTSTKASPFSGQTTTQRSMDMSASIVQMMGNSTTSMSMITPGPVAVSGRFVPGYTGYSTFVSDGNTFSTGSVFSTYFSANGSWYYSYYTTWSAAWASATTVYAAGESGYAIESNQTDSSRDNSGNNGDHTETTTTNTTSTYFFPNSTVYNTTEVIIVTLYNSSNVAFNASTTTHFFTYTEASASGNGAGAGGNSTGGNVGGASGNDAGSISSAVSVFSTQTVIYNSGATGGASGYQASGVIATPAPVITSTPVYSTQFVVSGSGNTGGASGFGASGAVQSMGNVLPSASVIINSYGTNGGSGYAASGFVSVDATSGAASGGFGTAASGAVTPAPTIEIVSVIVVSSGVSGASGFAASGIISVNTTAIETSGGTGTAASGIITPATTPVVIGTSVIVNSFGASGASGYAASGVISENGTLVATSGGTGTAASGVITPVTTTGTVVMSVGTAGTVIINTFGTAGGSGYAASGIISVNATSGGTPGGTGSAASGVVAPSSSSFSNTGVPRSGTEIPSSISVTIPPVSVPTNSITLSTPPADVTEIPSTGSTRSSTGGRFSNTNAPRSGTVSTRSTRSTRSMTLPISGPAPYPPLETASSVDILSTPIVTIPTGPVPYIPASSPSVPSGTGSSTMDMSTGLAVSSTGGRFSNTGAPRSGTVSTRSTTLPGTALLETVPATIIPSTGVIPTPIGNSTTLTGTAPIGTVPSLTAPTSPFGTAPPQSMVTPEASVCASGNGTGYTTMFVTTTVYGCYSYCQPAGYGPYAGGPQSFGPPQFGAPSMTGTAPTPSA